MTRKFITGLMIAGLVVCVVSGGCFSSENTRNIKSWKELLKLGQQESDSGASKSENQGDSTQENPIDFKETIDIDLYFVEADGKGLAAEKRTIEKTEGIARRTLEELIKGPVTPAYSPVFPEGTKLLDINIKSDGLCIVDFSSEVRHVNSALQEKLMVYAVVNTLGQFPTVKKVSFMIDGEAVKTLGGYVDISNPVMPDYNL
ncbi:MAG: GerMN domain-containing protein [Syntrophomonadaceae bacterium]|nr:GerMN domain-containing protein [Syntrophomonadaceae bacterium]